MVYTLLSFEIMRLPRPAVVGSSEGAVARTLAHIQAAQKVNVAGRDRRVQVFVFLQILEISFHQGMKWLHLRHEEMFALNGPIDHLVEAGGGGASLLGGGVAGRELGDRRSLCGFTLGEGRGAADQTERKEGQ